MHIHRLIELTLLLDHQKFIQIQSIVNTLKADLIVTQDMIAFKSLIQLESFRTVKDLILAIEILFQIKKV